MVIKVSILLLASRVKGFDYLNLNPCRLLCHLEHSIDHCKLVTTTSSLCENFFWVDGSMSATVIDRLQEDEYVQIPFKQVVDLLKVGKNGCENLCEEHADCVDVGSECKVNGVCLNLFWNRGSPNRAGMTSCYQLSPDGCNDGTPILCGNERNLRFSDEMSANGTESQSSVNDDGPHTTRVVQAAEKSASSAVTSLTATSMLVIPYFMHR